MRILIAGAGKMGVWLSDALCLQHEVAVFDVELSRLKFVFNTIRLSKLEEIPEFKPQMLINAANLQNTRQAFEMLEPYVEPDCILADIASVKNGIRQYYENQQRPFVSVHPMFGPTFARLDQLSDHHAIIINESYDEGKRFFRHFFSAMGIHLHEYSFEGHDQTIAYSLSVPFASSLVFAGTMLHQPAPGTTFARHLAIARGLLSEDDHLLSEILFNKYTVPQLKAIQGVLARLIDITGQRDEKAMHQFLGEVRENLTED